MLLLIRTNDCSDSRVHSNIYRLLNCHFLSVGLLSLLTPNILQQIRDTVHLVILNQGFLIELQYPRNEDHCRLHNVVPRKKGRTDSSNQSTSCETEVQCQSLTQAPPNVSFRYYKLLFKKGYIGQNYLFRTIPHGERMNYSSDSSLKLPIFHFNQFFNALYLLNDMTVANFRN